MKKIYPAIILIQIMFILLPIPSHCEEGDNDLTSLTIEEAQKIALKNHPYFLAADFNAKAAEEKINSARAAYFPQISGHAVRAYAGQRTSLAASGTFNNQNMVDRGSLGVDVAQLITDFGKTGDMIKYYKLGSESQKQNAMSTCQSVLLGVKRAYYNVLRSQSMIEIAESTVTARELMFKQISSLHNARMKSDLDLSIAKEVVNEANLLLLKAKTNMDDAQAALSEALGYGETRYFLVTDDTKLIPPPTDVSKLIADAVDSSPELASLKAKKEAAKKLISAQNKDNYPVINLVGFAGNTPIRTRTQKIDPNYAAFGVTLNVPFYTGGRISSEEKELQYKAQASNQDLLVKKNQLVRDVRTAFNDLQNTYRNIDINRELLKNATKAFELTQARYDIGKSSIVDLSQADLAKTRAQIAVTNATYDYFVQQAVLLNYQAGKDELYNKCQNG